MHHLRTLHRQGSPDDSLKGPNKRLKPSICRACRHR